MPEVLTPEILVIGGSLAGCAAAVSLQQRGFDVLVVEREREVRDRFKGEYLQPLAVQTLRRLGFSELVEGPDTFRIHRLRFRDLDDDEQTILADTVIEYPEGTYAAILPQKKLVMGL